MTHVTAEGLGTREGGAVGPESPCGGRANVPPWDFRCLRTFAHLTWKCPGRGGCSVARLSGQSMGKHLANFLQCYVNNQ